MGRPAFFSSLRGAAPAAVLFAALALPSAASAAGSAPPPRPRETPSEATTAGFGKSADSTRAAAGRAEAQKAYTKAWDLSEDAKKDLVGGKADSAKKRFGKALKKFKEATEIDPTYYEAWNMVGFCSRKTGDLKASLEAYQKCLAIEPEYAQAHEYLGETYLTMGDLAKAKEQLMWLVARKSDQAGELATKIEAFEKGGSAQPDSTAKGGGW
jgi:tetratricopeptide (TPR) repeat protein